MYRALTVDLGGVCFFTNLSEMNRLFIEETGISFRPADGGTYPFYYSLDRGEITVDEYFKALKDETKSNKVISELKEAYRGAYLRTSRLNECLLSKLAEIRRRQRVICVSTTNRFHEEMNRERGLFVNFDYLYFSHDLRSLGREFLREVLLREGANPSEILMVDNDENQLKEGRELGIEVILFKDTESLLRDLRTRGIHGL